MDIKIFICVIIFSLILMMHLIRLILKLPVIIGSFKVPFLFSVLVIIVLTLLIFWLIK